MRQKGMCTQTGQLEVHTQILKECRLMEDQFPTLINPTQVLNNEDIAPDLTLHRRFLRVHTVIPTDNKFMDHLK